ncbi:18551_t:CDS:2 [Funneliformis geosporum]|uniref:18551_t:CDS:1 n=1 Tax=Funneliformis geosporum TaxID=1117311 RepID=A0A9W4WRC2_9GLOM|nr:18551_t:CDS:2 [Funneliformis geosporum]
MKPHPRGTIARVTALATLVIPGSLNGAGNEWYTCTTIIVIDSLVVDACSLAIIYGRSERRSHEKKEMEEGSGTVNGSSVNSRFYMK